MCISLNRLLVYHLDGIFTCKGDKQPNTENEADEQVMLFHIAIATYFTDILTTEICCQHTSDIDSEDLQSVPRYHHRDV